MLKKAFNQVGIKKVVVAMSGGVDSSVAAALLKKQGYDVVGVFMRFWGERQSSIDSQETKNNGGERNLCCSEGAERAAQAVAKKLKIPFYVLDFEKEFKKEVVDHFLSEETRGRTPNPCVVCNKKIKFGLMFKKALEMKADFVATGHYARIFARENSRKDKAKLFKAKDKDKDQSYFLYNLTQGQLRRVLFPLGNYTKPEVYTMAKKWRLPYRKEESFDLCFVANDRESFIKKYLKLKPGLIKNKASKILGQHQGLALYTVGQRKRLDLSQGPWWVIEKDEKKNILYVSNNEKDLYSKELIANNINWLNGAPPRLPAEAWVKIRYKSDAERAVLRSASTPKRGERAQGKNQLKLIFMVSQRAITPSQSAVFYGKNNEVLGGGVIEKNRRFF